METWKPVAALEGSYEVSDHGRVRSLDRVVRGPFGPKRLRGVVLKPCLRHGYEFVAISAEGVALSVAVHILVAVTFIGPRPDGYDTCHNDGNRRHNHVSNLRYDTIAGNHRDKAAHGTLLYGEAVGNSKLSTADVIAIRKAVSAGAVQRRVAAKYHVSPALICRIVGGHLWKRAVGDGSNAVH